MLPRGEGRGPKGAQEVVQAARVSGMCMADTRAAHIGHTTLQGHAHGHAQCVAPQNCGEQDPRPSIAPRSPRPVFMLSVHTGNSLQPQIWFDSSLYQPSTISTTQHARAVSTRSSSRECGMCAGSGSSRSASGAHLPLEVVTPRESGQAKVIVILWLNVTVIGIIQPRKAQVRVHGRAEPQIPCCRVHEILVRSGSEWRRCRRCGRPQQKHLLGGRSCGGYVPTALPAADSARAVAIYRYGIDTVPFFYLPHR